MSFEATLKEKAAVPSTSSVQAPTKCEAGTELNLNGCQLELQPSGAGSVTIGPAGCGTPTFSVGGCGGLSLPVPTKLKATYQNSKEAKGTFSLTIDDSEVEYTSNGSCKSSGSHSDFKIYDYFEVKGKRSGESDATSVTTGGLYVTPSSEASKLEAPEYPVTISGEQFGAPFAQETKLLERPGAASPLRTVCKTAQYNGGELTGPATSLTVTPTYSGCTLEGLEATVEMHSCRYVYSGFKYDASQEADYTTTEIACNSSEKITIDYGGISGCIIKIPPQVISGSETLMGPFASNGVSSLGVIASATKLKYSTNFPCELAGWGPRGSYEDGTSKSYMWLKPTFP